MNIYGATERTSGLQTPRLSLDDGRTHRGVWLSLRDPAVVDILAA